MSDDRYAGKPLLRLLELYVLSAIDELTEADEALLLDMTPKLSTVYETSGTWQEIVARQMDFPQDMPSPIRTMWNGAVSGAEQANESVDPNGWARAVVDTNFVD